MILWIGLIILGGALVLLIFNHDSGTIAGLATDDFATIAQYSAIGALISVGILAAYRGRIKEGLKHALTWILIALGLVAVYAFRQDFSHIGNQILAVLIPGYPAEQVSVDSLSTVTLRRRSDGHFVADVEIEDVSVTMLVDTGASAVVLTADDAARIGIELTAQNYSAPVSTANGTAMAAPIRLQSVAIGSLQFGNVAALVAKPDALSESLLGNTFLERLVSYEVRGDTLILRGQP